MSDVSDSDESCSSSSGPGNGFVWGNLDRAGALEPDEKTRYPEEFRDNMEDATISRDISSGIMKSRSEPILSQTQSQSNSGPLMLHDDYQVSQLGDHVESEDSEDFDAEDIALVPVPEHSNVLCEVADFVPQQSSENMFFAAPIKQVNNHEHSETFLPVLKTDSDGVAILKFSDMYIGGVEPFIEGLVVHRSITKSSVAPEGVSWFLPGDEVRFFDTTGSDIRLLDVLRQICHPLDHDRRYYSDKFVVGDHLCKLPADLLDPSVRLDESMFSLVEQLDWERHINWAAEDHLPLPSPPKLLDAFQDADHLQVMDVDMRFDMVTSRETELPSPQSFLPSERPKFRISIARRKTKRRISLRGMLAPTTDPKQPELAPFTCPIPESVVVLPAPSEDSLAHMSIPNLNREFESMDWLQTVVWDHTQPPKREMLTSLVLNENDENMIFGTDSFEPKELSSHLDVENRFNISMDGSELYQKAGVEERAIVGRAAVQHALFAQELARPAYKSYFTEEELHFFHRPRTRFETAYVLARQPEKTKGSAMDSGTARKYVPKKEAELSARDGRIILAEYIEEHPPLVANVGMASEIITFYRQHNAADTFNPIVADGITKILRPEKDDESPFIADVRPGSTLSSMNCNMFAAPLFEHQVHPNEFLLIRTAKRTNWYIREIPARYVVGQIQPKVQVKTPNARDANGALKDMLSVFIYRLLRMNPKLLISEIFDAFPTQSETAIRAKLKEVADFQRGGHESGCWILNSERAKLPSDSAIREMVTPENMCEFASMRAGQHRLEKLGIEALLLWTPQLSSIISKLRPGLLKRQLEYVEQELQLTPWNLTSNFVNALQGRCLLKLQGPGNPLGRGAGFSYIKAPHRFEADPTAPKIAPAKALTGTDKDLRKLNMQELFNALVSFGIQESQVKDLPRWNRVGLLRQLCSDATLNGEATQFGRFARQQRNTNRVQQQRFLKEAQKIFDRQCETLRNPTAISLDDKSSDIEADEFAADLEDLLEECGDSQGNSDTGVMSSEQAEYEKFLKEQEEKRLIEMASQVPEGMPTHEPSQEQPPGAAASKSRTIRKRLRRREIIFDADGIERERVSIIDDPEWIEAYIADQKDNGCRLKELEDKAMTAGVPADSPPIAGGGAPVRSGDIAKSRIFRTKRGELKQPPKPRKRTLPGASGIKTAHRRFKEESHLMKTRLPRPSRPRPSRAPILGPNGKPMVKCSSCHTFGHTKSNRKCPNHPDNMVLKVTDQESKVTLSIAKVPTPKRHHGETDNVRPLPSMNADGEHSKPHHSSKGAHLGSHPAKKKRRRERPSLDNFEDELGPKRRATFRRRGDPQITLNSFFNGAIDATSDVLGVQTFCKPVTDDIAPNYSTIVTNQMYIDLLKRKVRNCAYSSCSDFAADLDLIRSNSALYNGPENVLTVHATIVVDAAKRYLSENQAVISETERHLIEYQDQRKLLTRLSSTIDAIWSHPDSLLFRFNVKKTAVPDYHTKVKNPVSLTTMKERIERTEYDSVEAFMGDMNVLVQNAETYNGIGNPIAELSRRLRQAAYEHLQLPQTESAARP